MGESSDVKCCVDESYDPNFRYASNEPTPPDWELGLGLGLDEGNNNGGGEDDQMATTGNPIKKSSSSGSSSSSGGSSSSSGSGGGGGSSGPFGSGTGSARSSNPGDVSNSNNGQCECKSLEKSIGWIKQRGYYGV